MDASKQNGGACGGHLKNANLNAVRSGRSGSRPSSQNNSRDNSEERDVSSTREWKCDKCNQMFQAENSRIVECEYCGIKCIKCRCIHRCIKCLNLSVTFYNNVSGREDFPWFCENCLYKTLTYIKEAKSIEDRCNDFLSEFRESVNKKFESVDKEVGQCKADIMKIKEDIQAGGSAAHQGRGPTSAPTTVSEAAKEVQARVDRKNNIVIYNVPEPNSIMKEDVETQDRETLNTLCSKMGVSITQEEVLTTRRLGRRQQKDIGDQTVAVPRTLLASLAEHTKPKIMRNLYKLRDADEIYRKMSVKHDMTRDERDQERHLREEARGLQEKDKSGNFIYLVRGMPWERQVRKIRIRKETPGNGDAAGVLPGLSDKK
jgi:hypothetical protein